LTELVTAADMRAIEADAIASGAVTGLELMERAGQGVVTAIARHWRDARSAVVLCGPGNNGGDGYVVARLLAEMGWQVRVHGMGAAETMPPDARANRVRWEAMGAVEALDEHAFRRGPSADVYVDAIFGTGLTRAPEGDLLSLLRYLGGSGGDAQFFTPRLLAVDAPSGLDLDSGRMLAGGEPRPFFAPVPLCAVTVTFEVPKIGHFLADGPACCGRVEVVDLGLSKWRGVRRDAVSGEIGRPKHATIPRVTLIDREPLVRPVGPFAHRAPRFDKGAGHKYDHGHALIVSGGAGHTGASRLAARAALRVGAGLVTVASPPNALMENAMHLTAIMTRRCDGAEELATILEDARFNAVCVGPGLGVGERTRAMVLAALGGRRKVVLDADALTSFEDEPDALFEAIRVAYGVGTAGDYNVVLTPHAGEFRRLFPDLAEAWQPRGDADAIRALSAELSAAVASRQPTDLANPMAELARHFAKERPLSSAASPTLSKVDAARAAAKHSGAIVLLKGPDTVIATPSGFASINSAAYDRAVPWLATAGAGDVLAGLIAGLAVRSPVLRYATENAAWLHVEAARAFGPGLIAEDLPEVLPKVFRDLGL
jgi:hydroxyethylthiazole kinase-like uncharacterized protein yjeF